MCSSAGYSRTSYKSTILDIYDICIPNGKQKKLELASQQTICDICIPNGKIE